MVNIYKNWKDVIPENITEHVPYPGVSIQAAINKVAVKGGGLVVVHGPGTYQEDLTIPDGVCVMGECMPTIIGDITTEGDGITDNIVLQGNKNKEVCCMKIEFFYSWTAPWNECELCFLGPAICNDGDGVRLGFGLFFIEFGLTFHKKVIRRG